MLRKYLCYWKKSTMLKFSKKSKKSTKILKIKKFQTFAANSVNKPPIFHQSFMLSKKSLRDKNLKRVCGLGRVDLISGIIPRNENQKRSDLVNLRPLWSNGPLSNLDNYISKSGFEEQARAHWTRGRPKFTSSEPFPDMMNVE